MVSPVGQTSLWTPWAPVACNMQFLVGMNADDLRAGDVDGRIPVTQPVREGRNDRTTFVVLCLMRQAHHFPQCQD
jgi:hypothetical protein